MKVDLRVITMDVPAQEAITRDNVTVKVNAVVYFRVVDPENAVVKVLDYVRATSLIAQTTLRSVLGQSDLDELLSRARPDQPAAAADHRRADRALGHQGHAVEVRDVELPQTMQRAMARQAEAEREKRAKIIHAEGEFEASAAARRRRPSHRRRAGDAAAALPADADRDRRREELDDHLPAADRPAVRVHGPGGSWKSGGPIMTSQSAAQGRAWPKKSWGARNSAVTFRQRIRATCYTANSSSSVVPIVYSNCIAPKDADPGKGSDRLRGTCAL